MATVTRGSILNRIREMLGIQNLDTPSQIGNQIVPVLEVSPQLSDVPRSQVSTTTGTITLYTTDADKEFRITYLCLSSTKDVACDLTSAIIQVTQGGRTVSLLPYISQTLTAESVCIPVSFPKPIKIDKGSSITISGTFTVGACTRRGTVEGYYLE